MPPSASSFDLRQTRPSSLYRPGLFLATNKRAKAQPVFRFEFAVTRLDVLGMPHISRAAGFIASRRKDLA